MTHPLPTTIDTGRLLLRPQQAGDLDAIHAYAGDAQVARWMDWPRHATPGETRAWMRARAQLEAQPNHHDLLWMVVERASGELAGGVGMRWTPPKADFGFVLARRFWGKGYATEATAAVVAAAWARPEVVRLWATCHPDNHASARVLEKLGLWLEARLARWSPRPNLPGDRGDSLLYARVK